MRYRAQCFQLAVESDLKSNRAHPAGTAFGVTTGSPPVLDRHGVITGRQHRYVGLRIGGRRSQRGVAVEEQQLLRSRLGSDGRDDLHPVQPAFPGVSPRDFHPAGAWHLDRNSGYGLSHRVGRRAIGLLAGIRRRRRRCRRFPCATGSAGNPGDPEQHTQVQTDHSRPTTHPASLAKSVQYQVNLCGQTSWGLRRSGSGRTPGAWRKLSMFPKFRQNYSCTAQTGVAAADSRVI